MLPQFPAISRDFLLQGWKFSTFFIITFYVCIYFATVSIEAPERRRQVWENTYTCANMRIRRQQRFNGMDEMEWIFEFGVHLSTPKQSIYTWGGGLPSSIRTLRLFLGFATFVPVSVLGDYAGRVSTSPLGLMFRSDHYLDGRCALQARTTR